MSRKNENVEKNNELTQSGLGEFAPYLMNRIAHRYNQSVVTTMNNHGLSIPKMRTLAALAAQGDLSVNELTVYAIAEQSTMSRTLDQMVAEGLISRQVSPQDSRARVISLTPSGHGMYKLIWPDMIRAESEMLAGLNAKERRGFVAALNKILLNIRVNEF
jgi:DNA-binding MarR family transcriptional regulator